MEEFWFIFIDVQMLEVLEVGGDECIFIRSFPAEIQNIGQFHLISSHRIQTNLLSSLFLSQRIYSVEAIFNQVTKRIDITSLVTCKNLFLLEEAPGAEQTLLHPPHFRCLQPLNKHWSGAPHSVLDRHFPLSFSSFSIISSPRPFSATMLLRCESYDGQKC